MSKKMRHVLKWRRPTTIAHNVINKASYVSIVELRNQFLLVIPPKATVRGTLLMMRRGWIFSEPSICVLTRLILISVMMKR